jgi:hypothetical protein
MQCAYADAAFAQWGEIRTWRLGRIHETQYSGHSSGSINSIGANFIIQTSTVWPYPGQPVEKMGKKTGWTFGNVTQTNVDISISGSNIRMLSQIKADYGSSGGDSGSPVFEILSDKNVSLLGIHWGHDYSSGDRYFSFSGFIISHLGGNISFK